MNITTEVNKKRKFHCSSNIPNTTCTIQYNHSANLETELIRVGDKITGWIIRKNLKNQFFAIGITNFGRTPPKYEIQLRYIESLKYTSNYLKLLLDKEYHEPFMEAISEVKGLFNRSVKKDQWDWLFIYQSFSFKDDIEAVKLRDKFVKLVNNLKNLGKGKISKSEIFEFNDSILQLFQKVNKSIIYLESQHT